MSDDKKSKRSAPIVRYTKPTGFDTAPFGKQWLFIGDDERHQMYIQLSTDANTPRWETMGYVMEVAFEHLFNNDEFLDQCLRIYNYRTENPSARITTIIKENEIY